jgi:pimeloyl-ACP methyl ester carboxylesterase
MKNKFLLLLTILTLGLMLIACGSDLPSTTIPEDARAGDLIWGSCKDYQTDQTEYSVDCATLVVPENHDDASSKLISIPVKRIHSSAAEPAEPIFFLEGGPGLSNMGYQPSDALLENHTVVMVGYRGADGSVMLDCPEVNQALNGVGGNSLSNASLDAMQAATQECADHWQAEGIDLSRYTIVDVVKDLEMAREALEYRKINLLGESYGTRVEQIYARLYPESIRRMALVGVNPPGHFTFEPEVIDSQIAEHAALCAADPYCSTRTDDLSQSMRNALKDLPERWLIFPIDPGKVRMMSFVMLYHRDTAAIVFDAYLAAEQGDYSGFALMTLMHDQMMPRAFIWGDLLAKGGTDFEPERDYRTEMNPPDSILGSPVSLIIWGSAPDAWPITFIDEELREVHPIDTETLLVSGSIDFSTPPQFASEELEPYLTNGEHIFLAEFGHTQDFKNVQPEAAQTLLATFFASGEVDRMLFSYIPMNYEVSMGFPALMKISLGLIIGLVIVLILIVWWVIRRVMARRAEAGI